VIKVGDEMENQDATQWRFLPLSTNDGYTNMAIDEAIILSRMKSIVPNTLRLYQWSPSTVSVGMHQSIEQEVDAAEIDRRGFQLVRRISGGGAVLHASGAEITYSVVARIPELIGNTTKGTAIEACYHVILEAIQKTLAKISLSSMPGVIHCPAMLVDGKKFSGNAQCIKNNFLLQHGTILLSVDPDEMYSVLRPPETVTRSRMVRSVKAKVMGLEDYLGTSIDPVDFGEKFKESFSELLGITFIDGALVPEELALVEMLKTKYADDAWRLKYP
jgi:lipoate-protein ligase A